MKKIVSVGFAFFNKQGNVVGRVGNDTIGDVRKGSSHINMSDTGFIFELAGVYF